MHAARWLHLVWILALLAGCQSQAIEQPVIPATATVLALSTPTSTPTSIPIPPTATHPSAIPATFEDCAASGGQIVDSFPRTCQVPGGTVLGESLPEGIVYSKVYKETQARADWVEPTADGGVLVTGAAYGWVGFVLKVDAEGNQEWLDEVGLEVASSKMGEHIFDCFRGRESLEGGYAALCYEFLHTSTQIYWVRYDPSGQRISAERLTPKPGMALVLDEHAAPAWFHTFGMGGGRITETADGGYALTLVTSFNGPDDRTYIVKADGSRHYAWDRLLCVLTGQTPQANDISCHANSLNDIIETQDGGFIIAGTNYTSRDPYLLKIDSRGKTQWIQRFGYGTYYHTSAVRQLADGGYLIAGSREANALLLRTDKDGKTLWEKRIGNSQLGSFNHLVRLANGDFLAAGTLQVMNGKEENLWLVRLKGE